MKPKIVISTYDEIHNPHYSGGGARAIHEVARRLAATYEITIVCGTYRGAQNGVKDGVRYVHIGHAIPHSPPLSHLMYSWALPSAIRKIPHDVWIESFTPPCPINLLQVLTNKPVIGLVHMLPGADMARKYHLPFHLFEKIGLATYARFIVTSPELANQIKTVNQNAEIAVIQNGIDKIRQNSGKANYAIYTGRFEINQKGLDLLLQSWEKVDGKLLLVGALPHEERSIHTLIAKHRLHKKITVVKRLGRTELAKFVRDAAFVVIQSRYETYSLAALEAHSYGLPTVSYDIPGLRWQPKAAGIKILPYDTQAFARACNLLFTRSETRQQMGVVGQTYAARYTWDKVATRYKQYLQRLIKQLENT